MLGKSKQCEPYVKLKHADLVFEIEIQTYKQTQLQTQRRLEMSDEKADGLAVAGGFSLMIVIAAPIMLLAALFGLAFKAPLAALIGAAISVIYFGIAASIIGAILDSLSVGSFLALVFLVIPALAGGCFAMVNAGFMQKLFEWECKIIHGLLKSKSVTGRLAYVVIQFLPTIYLLGFAYLAIIHIQLFHGGNPAMLPESGEMGAAGIVGWAIVGFFILSQFAVLSFHRRGHPIGRWATIGGHPSELAKEEAAIQAEAASVQRHNAFIDDFSAEVASPKLKAPELTSIFKKHGEIDGAILILRSYGSANGLQMHYDALHTLLDKETNDVRAAFEPFGSSLSELSTFCEVGVGCLFVPDQIWETLAMSDKLRYQLAHFFSSLKDDELSPTMRKLKSEIDDWKSVMEEEYGG